MNKIIFPSTKKIKNNNPKVVVLGKLETMHIGHISLIKKAKKISIENNYELVVMLFSQRKKNNFYSFEERMMFANKYKPDFYLEFNPNKKNLSKTYLEFNDYLKSINARTIVIGNDFRYGKNREGSFETLIDEFEVNVIDEVRVNNKKVSTSEIFNAINNCDLVAFKHMMNHHFFYEGKVIKGLGNGHKLKMPTANVKYPNWKIDIGDGIYYSFVIWNGKRIPSLTSISNNPTLNGKSKTYETYIYNFDEKIYGEKIFVELLEKYRDPIKFNSLEELKEKLEEDKKIGINYFNL